MRLEPAQRERYERAAKREGKTLGEWLRWLGDRETAPPLPTVVTYTATAALGATMSVEQESFESFKNRLMPSIHQTTKEVNRHDAEDADGDKTMVVMDHSTGKIIHEQPILAQSEAGFGKSVTEIVDHIDVILPPSVSVDDIGRKWREDLRSGSVASGKQALEQWLNDRGARPISNEVVPGMSEAPDEWEARCQYEFRLVLHRAAKEIRGWGKMTWQQRYETLKEQKEAQG